MRGRGVRRTAKENVASSRSVGRLIASQAQMRLFSNLAFQALIVVCALCCAYELMERVVIVPRLPLLKLGDLSVSEFQTVLAVFVSVHTMFAWASSGLHGSGPFVGARRWLAEMYVVMSATSVAGVALFTLSRIPFNINFYAWIYVLLGTLYALCYLIATGIRRVRAGDDWSLVTPWLSVRPLVMSFWTPLTVLVALTPGALAVAYKTDRDFANAINLVRINATGRSDSRWSLVDVIPGGEFEQPMDVRFAPLQPERFYLLARPGRLYRYGSAADAPGELLLDISEEVGSVEVEMGAMSFALHPEFGRLNSRKRGYVYIWYTYWRPGTQHNRLSRFDLSLPTLEERRASRLNLIDLRRPPGGFHNGGSLFFDAKGFLYFSVGDLNDVASSQRIDARLAGGVFRIDVDQRGGRVSGPTRKQPQDGHTQHYFIPRANPWYGQDGALGEFIALGFRNPFRVSLDEPTGTLWIGDVGENRWEEHNRVAIGDNGQWAFREGPAAAHGLRPETIIGRSLDPLYAYEQTSMHRAALGGILYRGERYPRLHGKYVFGDNNSGTFWYLDPERPGDEPVELTHAAHFGQQGPTAIVAAPGGEIWVTVLGSKTKPSGKLLKLRFGEPLPTRVGSELSPRQVVTRKYEMVCSRCHGLDGRGMPEFVGSPTLDVRPDFTSAEWQRSVTDTEVHQVIRDGGAPFGKSSNMPSWEELLPPQEIDLMVAYIRTFSGARGADAK